MIARLEKKNIRSKIFYRSTSFETRHVNVLNILFLYFIIRLQSWQAR